MKIKKFAAKDVHGYLDFDIEFREQLTFLIGINGAGKTTALKLLLGLITPSFKEFCQIGFTYAELLCSNESEIVIKAHKKDDDKITLSLTIDGDTISNEFQIIQFKDFEEKQHFDNYREKLSIYTERFSSLEVVKKIENLTTPFFLGLERQMFDRQIIDERMPIQFRSPRYRNMLPSITNQGLLEVQELVYDYTRQIARQQFRISDEFKNKIFKNSFHFVESTGTNLDKIEEELPKIESRRKQFDKAIENLQIGDASDEIIHFFTRIKETLNKVIENKPRGKDSPNQEEFINYFTKWFINSHQLDRIDEIIKLSDDYQKKISKLKEPVERLELITNKFLSESNKSLKVSGEGEIKILIQKNKKTHANSIFELSSGERQIIIMLAHLIFSSNKSKSPIFVIDEPELSLHITWQEIFVDSLIAANPSTQYILATHSPSIIAKVERESMCEDLTQKKKP